MSLLSISLVEANVEKLNMDIRDLENEVETTKGFIQELTSSLARQNIRLHQLEHRIHEKRNMIQTLSAIRDHRKERLRHETNVKSKIVYIDRCQHYLSRHSQHVYSFHEMIFDEIVEYAHKLHLLRGLREWIGAFQVENQTIELPKSEMEMDIFESRNMMDDDKVVISSGTTTCHIIPLLVWYSLFEIDNEHHFTIESDISIFNHMIIQKPFDMETIL